MSHSSPDRNHLEETILAGIDRVTPASDGEPGAPMTAKELLDVLDATDALLQTVDLDNLPEVVDVEELPSLVDLDRLSTRSQSATPTSPWT